MANCLYTILKNIFPNTDQWADVDVISFDKMSLQYTGIICWVICLVILSFKELSSILKITDKGIYAILTFCFFIIFLGIWAIAHTDFTFVTTGTPGKERQGREIILFSYNIETLVGIFGIAYLIHNLVNGMVRNNNLDVDRNERVIGKAYGLVFFFIVFLELWECLQLDSYITVYMIRIN